MCGIAGIVTYHPTGPEVRSEELLAVRDQQASRGPDGAGVWFATDRRAALGHRRLAIIGLDDNSAQPMPNEDGSVHIVFNGEIYNYRDLRQRLLAHGHTFRSESDTEVLVHLYEERGRDMVHDLRGMFAFAVWDQRRRRLLLARDPLGIRPLYYSDDGQTIRFASQVKALLAGGAITRELNPAGVVGFLLWGSVPEPHTVFRAVRVVPAGSTIEVDGSGVADPAVYFRPAAIYTGSSPTASQDIVRLVRTAVTDSVRAHLVADVPVGAFLSAGIDSAVIVALASAAAGTPLKTVTLAFDELRGSPEDESVLAQDLARQLGCDHQTVWVSPRDVLDGMSDVLRNMDQPTIDGINSYWVSHAARLRGLKVALSGLGGDELFAGYDSFRLIPTLEPWLRRTQRLGLACPAAIAASVLMPPRRRARVVSLLRRPASTGSCYLAVKGIFAPEELPSLIDRDLAVEGLRQLAPLRCLEESYAGVEGGRARVAVLEQSFYMRNQLLRDADWASMAHSLEVRVPFVDSALYNSIAPAILASACRQPKALLAQVVGSDLLSRQVARKKTGFTFPFSRWIAEGSWSPFPKEFPETLASPDLPRTLDGWREQVRTDLSIGAARGRSPSSRRRYRD